MSGKLYEIKMIDGKTYYDYLNGTNEDELKDELLKKIGIWNCLMIGTVKEVVK